MKDYSKITSFFLLFAINTRNKNLFRFFLSFNLDPVVFYILFYFTFKYSSIIRTTNRNFVGIIEEKFRTHFLYLYRHVIRKVLISLISLVPRKCIY